MRVADGVEMLEVAATVMGESRTIHPALIWDDEAVILVDTGFPGQLPLFREAVEGAGVPFERLTHVLATHQDLDHIGSAAALLAALPGQVELLTHEEEAPYVQGDREPVKLGQLAAGLGRGAQETRAFYERFKAGYERCRVRVDRTLTDGEELPYCGGVLVIHTPGHTPGHLSLYLRQSKTLIAGDTLFAASGRLALPPAHFDSDHDLAVASLRKLTRYDIEAVICYHGGLCRDDVGRQIAELAGG